MRTRDNCLSISNYCLLGRRSLGGVGSSSCIRVRATGSSMRFPGRRSLCTVGGGASSRSSNSTTMFGVAIGGAIDGAARRGTGHAWPCLTSEASSLDWLTTSLSGAMGSAGRIVAFAAPSLCTGCSAALRSLLRHRLRTSGIASMTRPTMASPTIWHRLLSSRSRSIFPTQNGAM